MGTGEQNYLVFVLIAFAAFAVAGVFGIVKYQRWKARRGGTADTGLGPDRVTPPSYPPKVSHPKEKAR